VTTDTKQLPPQLEAILQRVQNSANYMPEWQTEVRLSFFQIFAQQYRLPYVLQQVLVDNLGSDWRSHFESFDLRPFAAASIGQVHSAVLASSSPLAEGSRQSRRLAVKVQFPGVRSSISGDLRTLRWLLIASAALPRGLYLENTLRVLERELDDECDYLREAECGERMKEHIAASPLSQFFDVPRVVKELSGPMVLTTEMMDGRPLKEVLDTDQDTRDRVRFPLSPSGSHSFLDLTRLPFSQIGSHVLQLCLHEVFKFRLMQTDPNWSNFLYNSSTRKVRWETRFALTIFS
jgi:aarF domain-containing kinase